MALENGKIPVTQLTALLLGYIIGASILIIPGAEAKQDAWIATLLGAGEATVFAFVYIALTNSFQGKTLVEMAPVVYGPILGLLISSVFILYLFHLGSLVIGNFSDFFSGVVMPGTPGMVFAILLVMVSALAVGYGLEVISRCSIILVTFAILLLTGTWLLHINSLHFENFFPILETPLLKLLWIAHGTSIFPFGDMVAFLMIIPFSNNFKKTKTIIIEVLVVASMVFMLAIVYNIGILGITGAIYTYPSYEAVRLLNLSFINIRMEIIIALSFIALGFLKITVLYYGVVLGVAQIFNLRTYRPLVFPVGILLVLVSSINFNNITENFEQIKANALYSLPFVFFIPLVTLMIARIRNISSKAGKSL